MYFSTHGLAVTQFTPPLQQSVEGFCVGDLLFFHCGASGGRFTHSLIKSADLVSMLTNLPKALACDIDFDLHLVHVEMVVGIDACSGKAILGGLPGKEKVSRKKLFQTYIDELPENDVSRYEWFRPKDRNFARMSAVVLNELIDRSIKYSFTSCFKTVVPMLFKPHETINNDKMNCQQIILNALTLTNQRMMSIHGYSSPCGKLGLHSQATPSRVFYKLNQHEGWLKIGQFPIQRSFPLETSTLRCK